MGMKHLSDYIYQYLTNGKYFFTKAEALSALGLRVEQFRYQAYRLLNKGLIRHLTRDSFMIIPAEYQNFGGIPPHWVIDSLMRYLGQDYYVALLSAAGIYGATHQQPMTFQVITEKKRRPIKLERGNITFHLFKECASSTKEQLSSPAGYVQISTKEQTMLDLVRFYQSSGYLSNVAMVIKDLAESANKAAFINTISKERNNTVLQRLGFILDYVGFKDLAHIVQQSLYKRKIQFVLLNPDIRAREGERDSRFKIIINDFLEIE